MVLDKKDMVYVNIDLVNDIQSQLIKPLITTDILICRKNINSSSFNWKTVTWQDILRAAKRLNNSNSKAIYNMSNIAIKKIIMKIASPLAFCTYCLFEEGVFPEQLKISWICSIFNKRPVNIPKRYHPVSILPIIFKLIEIIVYDQLSLYFELNNYLNITQFVFCGYHG